MTTASPVFAPSGEGGGPSSPSPDRGGALPATSALRGRLIDFAARSDAFRYEADGIVAVGADGRILARGPAEDFLPRLAPGTPIDHYPDFLISPGFVDAHIHLPQTRVIASFGTQLMDWLTRYTFVEEQKHADPAIAAGDAVFFLDELLRNGTTTAAVYASVHPGSIEALFTEAARRGMAMIGGKSMMDREAPAALLDTAESSYADGKTLIERWDGRERQRYAITPRFAITSTEPQLEAAGALLREFPNVLLQTHLSENGAELERVAELFPWAVHYTDVYDHFGLLSPRSLFGHCIHLKGDEPARLAGSGSVAVHCPTSNLFMGSGLFDLATMEKDGVRLALGSDIGGGTSYSMLRTAGEAYKVAQLKGSVLSAAKSLRLITRTNAEAVGLDAEIGSLEQGRYADLTVLDPRTTPVLRQRLGPEPGDLDEEVFALLILGDDRAVAATYIKGRKLYSR